MKRRTIDMPSPDAVEIEFSLSYAEWLRAIWALTLSSLASALSLLVFPLCGIALIALPVVRSQTFSAWDWTIVALCFGFVPLLVFHKAYVAYRNARTKSPHRYRFDREGLRVWTATSELKQRWAAIQRIRDKSGFLFLYFDKRTAHCIPLRVLTTHGGADALVRLANEARVPRIDA